MTHSFHQRGTGYHDQLGRHQLRLADESLQQLAIYCAVALLRQAAGHELRQFASDDITQTLAAVARDIYAELPTLTPPGRRRSPASPSRSRPGSLPIPPAQPGHGRRERATGGASAGLHPPALPL
jgi:hypothetical protein